MSGVYRSVRQYKNNSSYEKKLLLKGAIRVLPVLQQLTKNRSPALFRSSKGIFPITHANQRLNVTMERRPRHLFRYAFTNSYTFCEAHYLVTERTKSNYSCKWATYAMYSKNTVSSRYNASGVEEPEKIRLIMGVAS